MVDQNLSDVINGKISLLTYFIITHQEIKISRARKERDCEYCTTEYLSLVQKFPHCRKKILPKAYYVNVLRWQYYGNSARKGSTHIFCLECGFKYGLIDETDLPK